MTFAVGDVVRFSGQYRNAGRKPFDPAGPFVVVTIDGQPTRYTLANGLQRDGAGRYSIEVELDQPGTLEIEFASSGGDPVRGRSTYEVGVSVPMPASFDMPTRSTVADRAARAMMLEDLSQAGMFLTDSHSDAVVASAHAAMLARRSQARQDARKVRPLTPLTPTVPLRPRKR